MSNRSSVAIFLITSFALLAFAGRQATTAPSNVLVTNSTSQAVPIKPASGSAFATAITNTPNVHAYVTNGVSAPVPTTNVKDKSRFRAFYFFHEADGSAFDSTSFTVPAGKRLIIDCVSADASSDNANQLFSSVYIEAFLNSSSTIEGYANLTLIQPVGFSNFAASTQPMSFSAEAGENVYVNISRSPTNVSGICNTYVTLFGHWVTVP